jgi:FkbM family methyltransferase
VSDQRFLLLDRPRIFSAVARRLDDRSPLLAERLRWMNEAAGDPSLAITEQIVRRGDVALDIGANRGLFTARLLGLVGRAGRVHAFEAHPDHHERLAALGRGRRNFQLHRIAVSDAAGEAQFQVPTVEGRPELGMGSLEDVTSKSEGPVATLSVPTARLDDVVGALPRIDFIKCDVEGHEDEVLAGAETLLRRHRPSVLVEIEERHRSAPPQVAFDRLAGVGLRGWAIAADGLRPIEDFDVERDQRRFTAAPTGSKMPAGYVHNFVFADPDGAAGEALDRLASRA